MAGTHPPLVGWDGQISIYRIITYPSEPNSPSPPDGSSTHFEEDQLLCKLAGRTVKPILAVSIGLVSLQPGVGGGEAGINQGLIYGSSFQRSATSHSTQHPLHCLKQSTNAIWEIKKSEKSKNLEIMTSHIGE